MKLYRTLQGIIVESENRYYPVEADWDQLINATDPQQNLEALIAGAQPEPGLKNIIDSPLLPPVAGQEIWASGITYQRSKSARMDESKDAGGGDFYDRVYAAPRPELFFKSTASRAAGHRQGVRIRRDSAWNVPEPELTLVINTSGKIIGYTIGNDMSSRDIEGENPLYLPQAKTYDRSAAVGPGILITHTPLPPETSIRLVIMRSEEEVFSGIVEISQITRKFTDLVEYLYRETSFPQGCLLMTGTGIVPPNEFTLHPGDEIRITIDPVGTLVNHVE